MVLTGAVVQGEDPGDRQLVQRVGRGGRVRFAGLLAGLGAGDVLDAREGEQLAEVRRVDDVGGADRQRFAVRRREGDRGHPVPVRLGRDRAVAEQQGEPAGGEVRGEELLDDRERGARLVAEMAGGTEAGVEQWIGERLGAQRVVAPVEIAYPLAQIAVAGGDGVQFDAVAVGEWHGLRGEQATGPVGRLGEHDAVSEPGGGQRGGETAETGTDHQDIGPEFAGTGVGAANTGVSSLRVGGRRRYGAGPARTRSS